MNRGVNCPLTGEVMRRVFSATVLGRYSVDYYYSDSSGILQTEKPYWLEEAYASAINVSDTGIVRRNLDNCHRLEPVLYRLLSQDSRIVDCGGGYGLLTRLLRDIGFDCYWSDPCTENIFARGFASDGLCSADALLAFEVMEHLENPVTWMSQAFRQYKTKTMLFSTLTYENEVPSANWWYYGFNTGQHITFYQIRTLKLLAEKMDAKYIGLPGDLHLITDYPVRPVDLLCLTLPQIRHVYASWVRWRRKRLNRIQKDFEHLRA